MMPWQDVGGRTKTYPMGLGRSIRRKQTRIGLTFESLLVKVMFSYPINVKAQTVCHFHFVEPVTNARVIRTDLPAGLTPCKEGENSQLHLFAPL